MGSGHWLRSSCTVHIKCKLFSISSTKFGSDPNSQVSLVDAAMPGMLPVINKYCVEQAVKTGLGLKATINNFSKFDRKNYFYADLPQGYQISQFKFPIVGEGTDYFGYALWNKNRWYRTSSLRTRCWKKSS